MFIKLFVQELQEVHNCLDLSIKEFVEKHFQVSKYGYDMSLLPNGLKM